MEEERKGSETQVKRSDSDSTQKPNKGRHGRGKGRHDKERQPKKSFVPGNDFDWWNKIPELMNDATNLKVNSIAGTPVFGPTSLNVAVVPGVMEIEVLNVYGSEFTNTDAINLQFRDLFLRMFQKYRGISSYQYADLAVAEICAIEVFSMVAKLERIYGIINYYDKLNLNVPATLLNALHLTPTAANIIRTRLSDFRYDLNYLIRKASRICVPKDMSVLADKISLFGYVYKDHDARRSQLYVFDYEDSGFFDETSLTTGSAIKFEFSRGVVESGTVAGTPMIQLVDQDRNMFVALDTMISNLVGSDSVNKIYADLVVWFGEEAMLSMLPLPDDYIIQPVYSESILHKIHNMDIYAADDQRGSATRDVIVTGPVVKAAMAAADHTILDAAQQRWIYQTADGTLVTAFWICSDPGEQTSTYTYRGESVVVKEFTTPGDISLVLNEFGRILDSYHEDFTPEIVCEGCLFKAVPQKLSTSNGDAVIMASCAFEVITQARCRTRLANGGYRSYPVIPSSVPDSASRMSAFDWAPLLYEEYLPSGSERTYTGNVQEIFGDIDTYRAVSASEIARIHNAATLSGVATAVTVVNK